MVIYAIDPALYHIGYVYIDTEKEDFGFNCIVLNEKDDLASLYRDLLQRFKNVFGKGDFYFIEDVVFYPIRSRKVQAQVWSSIALLLAIIPRSAGYYLISPHKVKRCKFDTLKFENLINSCDFIDKNQKEHIIDAFRVLLVGLNEIEHSEKVLSVLNKFSLL
jgi:hypothetical protein